MKHAYLILAHNEFAVLKYLLQSIDDDRNDIFIHFDRKLTVFLHCTVKHAGLYILQNPTSTAFLKLMQVKSLLDITRETSSKR